MRSKNQARVVLAELKTGWWRVWLRNGPVESCDVSVKAESMQKAAELALAELEVPPGEVRWYVSSIEPGADERNADQLTIRYIADAADVLTDAIGDDIAALLNGEPYEDTEAVSVDLPGVFTLYYTPELIDRFADVVDVVAGKLARYPDTYLASTAEELAGHALIREVNMLLDIDLDVGKLDELNVAEIRERLDEIHELAFEDHDVLLLFDPQFDGIESSELGERMGVANLHPNDWFRPFRSHAGA
jgi:hypothetical protein